MDIRTSYTRSQSRYPGAIDEPNQKTLWGVFDGDSKETRLLYVFSGPGRLAGTTLLMHDRVDATEQDAMWLYLRSFDIFKRLESKTQHATVPGTALTYEDSRGFIPLDKYHFHWAEEATPEKSVGILGCPRSAAIRENLGYRSLRLRVDPKKKVVLAVEYTDLGGRPLKTYTLLSDTKIGERVFPREVRIVHRANGIVTEIGYEYWLPAKPPPRALFEPSTKEERFIDRLETYIGEIGQGERIREELERADVRVREFEEKLRRIQESERMGKRFRQ